MKLYNSLTKTVEEFLPISEGNVSMYSCGPTVYNNLHIGNLSAFIYADLLRRVLSEDYNVKAVMNITDIDDKTIRDSKQEYPELEPLEALKKLTTKYEAVFLNDIERIGNDVNAVTFIRATETIAEMIQMTQTLLDKGFAYPADDGIYFSIKNYELAGFTYGQLQHIDRSNEQARISNDEYDKDSASDFALWKKAESGEPSWKAEFIFEGQSFDMPGRPGWHIECSAMSQKLLGLPFDIHTGGIDLKFPHHENEIAQSCSYSNEKVFANYFVHNNHVLIDGKKMSKSLNNFYTLRDIEEKGFSPQAFRLLVLSSHYRNESNFSWEILEAAQNRLNNWQKVADLRWQLPSSEENIEIYETLKNDINTPQAITVVDEVFDNYLQNNKSPSDQSLSTINSLLGINLFGTDISDEQKQIIKDREIARQEKNWSKSDELRDELKKQNIEIRDTENGTIWSKI